MTGWGYSIKVWLVMVLYAAPLLLAWNLWSPLDDLPYLLCLLVGGAVSVAVWRAVKRLPATSWFVRWQTWAICAAPCLAIGVGLGANVWLDKSPSQTHDAVYLGFHSAHKGPPSVRLSSWRDASAQEHLTCTAGRREALCPYLQPGTKVLVTTRRGAFGWDWVEKVAAR